MTMQESTPKAETQHNTNRDLSASFAVCDCGAVAFLKNGEPERWCDCGQCRAMAARWHKDGLRDEPKATGGAVMTATPKCPECGHRVLAHTSSGCLECVVRPGSYWQRNPHLRPCPHSRRTLTDAGYALANSALDPVHAELAARDAQRRMR